MEKWEKDAISTCRQDIKNNLLVSDNVVRKLACMQFLSQKEAKALRQERHSHKKNTHLIEIMKKKEHGFQALLKALTAEGIVNNFCVNKLDKTARDIQAKSKDKGSNTINAKPHHLLILKQLFSETAHLIDGQDSQRLGKLKTDISQNDIQKLLVDIQSCRLMVDPDNVQSDSPMAVLLQNTLAKQMSEYDKYADQRQKELIEIERLREENFDLRDKVVELEKQLEEERKNKNMEECRIRNREMLDRLERIQQLTINFNGKNMQFGSFNTIDQAGYSDT